MYMDFIFGSHLGQIAKLENYKREQRTKIDQVGNRV
jgi:hypothetical protein